MDINWTHEVDDDGVVTVYSAVTRTGGLPQRSCNVRVSIDGKAKKPSPVDKTGIATTDLGKLKVGRCVIRAEVLGANPPAVDERTITIGSSRRATKGTEWFASLVLLFAVLRFGYTTLAVVSLVSTIIVLFVASVMDDEDTPQAFLRKITNNDWVYYMMRTVTLVCFVIWITSLESLNPLKVMLPTKSQLTDPWANDGWKYFFIGEAGWREVTFSFLRWTLLAYPISFWDNWFAARKANAAKATKTGGIGRWLLHVFIGEGVGEALWTMAGRKK